MKIICHRINSHKELKNINVEHGVEVDVRYHENEVVLNHDPFHGSNAEKFSLFLSEYKLKGTLIINLKTEGIENECLKLLVRNKIKSWFFLDMSQPYLVKYSNSSEIHKDNLAVRFSDYEPVEYALSFKDKVGWVWLDRFKTNCLTEESYSKLKEANFNICIVSPELQGESLDTVKQYKLYISNFDVDAVCTKFPEIWEQS